MLRFTTIRSSARAASTRGSRAHPWPEPGRVRAGHPDPALPDPHRARLRPRLSRLHQPPEHVPDRGQLRGQQPDRVGRDRRRQRRRPQEPSTTTRSSPTPRRSTATWSTRTATERSTRATSRPTFTDRNGNGKTTDIGDTGQVQIGCRFQVITPGIANVVGGTVMVAASSSFPVKTGMTASGSGAGGGGSPPMRRSAGTASSRPSRRRPRSPGSPRSTSSSGTRPAATRPSGCGRSPIRLAGRRRRRSRIR